jgi:hypothetical protein
MAGTHCGVFGTWHIPGARLRGRIIGDSTLFDPLPRADDSAFPPSRASTAPERRASFRLGTGGRLIRFALIRRSIRGVNTAIYGTKDIRRKKCVVLKLESLLCHAPQKRGIQYPPTDEFRRRHATNAVRWLLDRPLSRAMTSSDWQGSNDSLISAPVLSVVARPVALGSDAQRALNQTTEPEGWRISRGLFEGFER